MKYSHPQIRQTARRIPILCVVYFASFCFCYLFALQRNVLAQTQYMLSDGATVYHPLLAALLCTFLLSLVGIFLTRLLRWLPLRWLAAVWFPSFLLLAALTHWRFPQYGDLREHVSVVPYVVWTLLWLFWLCLGNYVPDSSKENASFSTYTWPNVLQLIVFTVVCVSLGNTDVVLHRTLLSDQYLSERNYEAILEEASQERHPSRTLSVMTTLALSETGQMGDRLFAYPQPYGVDGLLPQPDDSLMPYNLHRIVGLHLGAHKSERTPSVLFLHIISQRPYARPAARDYYLCALLLERRLDDFVTSLWSGLPADMKERQDSLCLLLPLHYREALALYHHIDGGRQSVERGERDVDSGVYSDDAMSAALQEFMGIYNSSGTKDEREFLCRERFGTTYWCYYFFP